jgi:hypothetical protein
MPKLKSYKIISDTDGNDFFKVSARDECDAAMEGLEQLGWFVSESNSEDEEEDENQYQFNF